MVKTPSTLIPIFGSAVAVSLVLLLYYEKRKHFTEASHTKDNPEDSTHSNQADERDSDKESPAQAEHGKEATACSSGTSYTSFDDDDTKSCQATSSSTSAYSTASDDNGLFPVGEYSTYRQLQVTRDLNDIEFKEMLNSPVVENHCTDERMCRSPVKHTATLEEYYNNTEANESGEVESTKLKSIVVAYNDIVPPLKPNTGETIHPSKHFQLQ